MKDNNLNLEIELPKYTREYCCSTCGLIWFAETTIGDTVICPECKNSNSIYPCDSTTYFYLYDSIVETLNKNGKKIHYEKKYRGRNNE